MRLKRSIWVPGAILLVTVVSGGWLLQLGLGGSQSVYRKLQVLQEVVEHISARYVEPVERSDLYDAALEGLIESLDDPNSSFMGVADWENLRIRTEGDYGGVGLYISERNGWITVMGPVPGTPGSRAGIRMGDVIIEVDGASTEEWDVNRAVDVLKGPPGTDVGVKIRRPGMPEPIPFTLTREKIELRSVPFAVMVSGRIGYVPLRSVSASSPKEIRESLDSLKKEGMEGLIFDLRGNHGGLLNQGIAITDLFLDDGDDIVETRGRIERQNQTYAARSRDRYPDLPIVILVNVESASAAEIIAGALQDHDRALVVGVRTFGKGSVQTVIPLSSGERLRLTTARWYTPAGRSIERSREDPLAVGEEGTLSLDGSRAATRRGATEPMSFKTMGGRTVFGGGGITPDVEVISDTLTTAEMEDLRKIFQFGSAFNTALFNYTVEYLRKHPDVSPGVRLEDQDLRDFHQRLSEWDIEVDRETFDGAHRYIRYRLEREIAREKGGEAGEFTYLRVTDRVLQHAIGLLEKAQDPRSLFEMAGIALPQPSGGSASGGLPEESK